MRRPFGRGRSEEETEAINLTPMLDVVFIMLIFFIVTATFVKEVGLDVNQPDDDKPKTVDPDKKSIVVRITNRDRIIIASRDIDKRSVRANIERLHAENPEAPVIIQPHPESTTDVMIHIMDSARQAGVYNVSLAQYGRQNTTRRAEKAQQWAFFDHSPHSISLTDPIL